jgi:hypothetical protein
MGTFDTILIPELAEFAGLLTNNDFRVYVFKSEITRMERGGLESSVKHLGFSRVVDDRECFASVSLDGRFGGPPRPHHRPLRLSARPLLPWSFSMPIKPSREHGSGMFIGGDHIEDFDLLTLPNAMLYASPTGRNHLVGTHENDNGAFAHLYVEIHDDEIPAILKADLQDAKSDADERRTRVVD